MPPNTQTESTYLQNLSDLRQVKVDAWSEFIEAREKVETEFVTRAAGDDKPTEAEVTTHEDARATYRAEADQRESEIKELDKRIADQEEVERRRADAAKANKGLPSGIVEPLTYTRESGRGAEGVSYYRDLASYMLSDVNFQSTTSDASHARLQRHAAEMVVEMPKRAKSRERRAYSKVQEAEGTELPSDPFHRGQVSNPFEYRVEPNRADGYGGYFVPPLWLPDEFIPQLVAHLVAAALCRQMDLPQGTDSINIPAVNAGTAVGYQQADNAGVLTQDWTDTAVQANVKTIAGDSDVALQLLEQSPHGLVDEVITMNLVQQYNAFLDQQVLAGDGLNASQLQGGHLKGLYPATNWTNTNSVTWTATNPAAYTFPSVLGVMASQIAKTRYDQTNLKYVLHGRRFFWYATGLDGNDRPLVGSSGYGPWNVPALMEAPLPAEGLAGSTNFGAPIYVDDNIGTADATGGGSAQDYALAALWDDLWLFQGDMRTNVFREVLSGSLGVRFQIYNYVAFLARYGQSIAVATGTGFSAPYGAVSSLTY